MRCLLLKSGECCVRKHGDKVCHPCDNCDLPKVPRAGAPSATVRPPPPPAQPVPREKWPLWAKGLARLATSEDAGIGDVVERLARASGAKSLVEFAKSLGAPDCGCADRKATWNAEFPLRPCLRPES